MIQCKCGYIKRWCPFCGNNKRKAKEELKYAMINNIDNEIQKLQKEKIKLLEMKK